MIFHETISNLGLQEIPLKGRSYTWSNMQQDPLLEQLDWCFTSSNWISDYLSTLLLPLARTTSDYIPCMAHIGIAIPKAKVLRFESYWIDQPSFLDVVQSAWQVEVRANNIVTRISAKFKLLRRALSRWGHGILT
jgi:hypothetical protein